MFLTQFYKNRTLPGPGNPYLGPKNDPKLPILVKISLEVTENTAKHILMVFYKQLGDTDNV